MTIFATSATLVLTPQGHYSALSSVAFGGGAYYVITAGYSDSPEDQFSAVGSALSSQTPQFSFSSLSTDSAGNIYGRESGLGIVYKQTSIGQFSSPLTLKGMLDATKENVVFDQALNEFVGAIANPANGSGPTIQVWDPTGNLLATTKINAQGTNLNQATALNIAAYDGNWYVFDGATIYKINPATVAVIGQQASPLANADVNSFSIANGTVFLATKTNPTVYDGYKFYPDAPKILSDSSVTTGPDGKLYVTHAADVPGQILSGTGEAGSTITVYDGTKSLGTAVVDGTGSWTFNYGSLGDGLHTLTATATNNITTANPSGDTGPSSAALVYTVAAAAPTNLADVIPGANGGLANNIIIGTDGAPYVNAAGDTSAQALTGVAEASSTVNVYDNGTTYLGSVKANTAGIWTFSLGHLADGAHSLTATATDLAGTATGPASTPLAFTVDTVAPTVSISVDKTGPINVNGQVTFNLVFSKGVGTNWETAFFNAIQTTGTVTIPDIHYAKVIETSSEANLTTASIVISNVQGTGTLQLRLPAASVTDVAGNPLVADYTDPDVIKIDNTPPVVNSITDATALSNASNDSFTVTFSEAVSGVVAADFTATVGGTVQDTGITVSAVSASVYTVTVNGVVGDGTLRLDLKPTQTGIVDLAGNGISGGFTSGTVVTIDHTAPSIASVKLDQAVYKLGDTVNVKIQLSGSYDGNGAYTLGSGSTIDGVALSNFTYDQGGNDFTGSFKVDSGTTEVINGNVLTNVVVDDAAGNASAAYTTPIGTDTVDTHAPTAVNVGAFATGTAKAPIAGGTVVGALSTVDLSNGDSFKYSLGGTDAGKFTIDSSGNLDVAANATLVDGTKYNLTIGTTDLGGNTYTQSVTVTGFTVPNVTSIKPASTPTLTNSPSVSFTVVFSQAVKGVSANNFTLGGTDPVGTIGAPVMADNTGTTWTVPVTGSAGTGSLGLNLSNTTGISSTTTGTGLGGVFLAGQTYSIDTVPPTISIATPIAGDNKVNAVEASTGFKITGTTVGAENGQTVTVRLLDSTKTVVDTYTTIETANAWSVSVPAADSKVLANGAYTVTADVSDLAGNPATEATNALTVDKIAPVFTSVSVSPLGSVLGVGSSVTLTLTTSKPVVISGTPILTLNDGGTAVYDAANSSATSLVFDNIVASGDSPVATLTATSLSLPGGATITDLAGNPANLSLTNPGQTTGLTQSVSGGATFGVQIDTVAPVITAISESPSSGLLITGQSDVLTLSVSKAVTVSGSPTLALNDGGTATYNAAQSTSTSLVFNYTAGAGDTSVGSLAVTSLNGGIIKDSANNTLNASLANVSQTGPQVTNTSLFGTLSHDPTGPVGDIYALYETILGRAPDSAGLEEGIMALSSGTSLQKIAHELLGSAEYSAKYGSFSSVPADNFVNQLFVNGLHRGASPADQAPWQQALAHKTPRAAIAVDIAVSGESLANNAQAFQAGVYVPDPSASAIARLYYGLLGRAPDAGSLASFEAYAGQGGSLQTIAQDLMQSSEYAASHGAQSNAQFVNALFENALGHGAASLAPYGHELNHGTSRAAVAVQIVQTPEAIAHLSPNIETGFRLA